MAKKNEEATIQTIVDLLESEDGDRRTAAAIVLAELAPSSTNVLDGLRKACRHKEDAKLRKFAAEAIGAIAPKTIVKDLRPLLKDGDPAVRETAKRVLASGRGVTADDVARMLEAKDDKQKAGAIAVLGAMGDREARKRIVAELTGASAKLLDAAKDALAPILESLEGSAADEAVDELVELIDDGLSSNGPLASLLVDLLGLVPNEVTTMPLVRIASMPVDEAVRVRAVELLRRIVQGRKTGERAYETLLDVVVHDETPAALLGPAADTLVYMGLPISLEPRVRQLVDSDTTPIRRFAIRALGGVDMAPASKALCGVIESGDPTDRELAIEAALTTPNGRTALTKVLAKMTDEEKARQVAAGLKTKSGELMPPTLEFLEEAVVDADANVAPVIIDLLKHCGGPSAGRVNDTLVDRAMKLKKRGQYGDATELFRRVVKAQDDAESRFQLGVCELKNSKRVLSRGKNSDPCLQTLGRLLQNRDFPLLARLTQEPILGEEELYYLGFSLAEAGGDGEGLGGDILMTIAEGKQDTKLRRMAKNKLVTMGWLE